MDSPAPWPDVFTTPWLQSELPFFKNMRQRQIASHICTLGAGAAAHLICEFEGAVAHGTIRRRDIACVTCPSWPYINVAAA